MSETWIRDRWTTSGCSATVKITGSLEKTRTEYQRLEVVQSEKLGKLLLLDDVIHLCEADEFAYHEMIVHPAMHAHPSPKKVLIIGGGDGGTAREVLKHDVDEVHLCEIDKAVIDICRKHFPDISKSFDDPRLKVFIEDGNVFLDSRKGDYDIIIVDSSDPVGPAKVLFSEGFYRKIHDALKEDGIAATQSEGMFFDRNTIIELFRFNRKIFPMLEYYYALVPTYPSGTIGFSFCSKRYGPLEDVRETGLEFKYYSPEIHRAAFVLPAFMKKALQEA